MRYHPTSVRIAVIKKSRAKCWQGMEKRDALCPVDENVN